MWYLCIIPVYNPALLPIGGVVPLCSVENEKWTNALMKDDDFRHNIFRTAKNGGRWMANRRRGNEKMRSNVLFEWLDMMIDFGDALECAEIDGRIQQIVWKYNFL